ncbi:unnamed protein product [Boreogadus saida]
MKAYKSLEAFNYFVCGWVNDLGTKEAFNKGRLVFARCPHSRQEETNLRLCADKKGFCLINDGDNVMLDRSHATTKFRHSFTL